MEQIGASKAPVDENLVRHMILNVIRTYVKKFKPTFGSNVVIACDNRNYWRREYFEYYKASRKKSREASGHDWESIFNALSTVKQELKDYGPYKVVDVDRAEADDIIGVLARKYHMTEKIMILSSDKDFAQLQRYPNVEQYSPIMKKFIKQDDPVGFLKEMIIRGDKGDGVPNILSDDSSIIEGRRQKSLMADKVSVWLNQAPNVFCNENMLRNYNRNELMIDLTKIPQSVVENIINTYESSQGKTKQQFLNYLMSKRMKNLIEVAHEF